MDPFGPFQGPSLAQQIAERDLDIQGIEAAIARYLSELPTPLSTMLKKDMDALKKPADVIALARAAPYREEDDARAAADPDGVGGAGSGL